MGALDIAKLLLAGVPEVVQLAEAAIAALEANDEEKALALLDSALARLDANASATRVELEAVKARAAAHLTDKLNAKFGAGTTPAAVASKVDPEAT